MLRFLRRVFKLVLVLFLVACVWLTFAIWTGIYGIYSIPPSAEKPDGATMIVSRDAGEPMFNSPNAPKPAPKKHEKTTGLGFGTVKKPVRPLAERTMLTLPYIEWAYRKSLLPRDE